MSCMNSLLCNRMPKHYSLKTLLTLSIGAIILQHCFQILRQLFYLQQCFLETQLRTIFSTVKQPIVRIAVPRPEIKVRYKIFRFWQLGEYDKITSSNICGLVQLFCRGLNLFLSLMSAKRF